MKFKYPYKLYLLGFAFFVFLYSYGVVVLAEIFDEGKMNLFYLFIFITFVIFFSKYYLKRIREYTNRFLQVEEHTLIYHDHELEDIINDDNLDVIFIARHMQNYKIHRVIHIFKNDGTYYYITNEINHFNKLIEVLQIAFPNKYYKTRHLIRGFHEITKGFLFLYL